MSYSPPTVNYATTAFGTYTTLTGVQSVSINRGRQRFQDPYPQTVCTIELIPADSYATPLEIGQFIDVRDTNSGSSPCYFTGKIIDVVRRYDMPYNSVSGAAPGDRITITATGATGLIGSANLDALSIPAGTTVSNAISSIVLDAGSSAIFETNTIPVSALTLTGSALDSLNKCLQTGQMLMDDYDTERALDLLVFVYKNGGQSSGFTYSDTGATRFSAVEYQSSVQNTFNYVTVNSDANAPQITKDVSGPYNALIYNTFNETAAQALDLSGYLYNLLSGQLTAVPFLLQTNTTVDASCMAVAVLSKAGAQPIVGKTAVITFRGETVVAQIQGIVASFYVDRASVQLYFSPSLGVPFILDSSSFGVLDTNRLGF
jgi:hypothetical protein